MQYMQSCGKLNVPSARYPKLWLTTPEAALWSNGNKLQQTGKLRKLSQGRQSVVLSINPQVGTIFKTPFLTGGPIQGSHRGKLCGKQDTGEQYIEDNVGKTGPAHILSGSHRNEWP
jgi:hypothetical protein